MHPVQKPYTLEETHSILFKILKEFTSFCDSHHLCYYLAYGTMLGAVRHQGFIPWDDDIDVMMPEKDFFKLMEIYQSEDYAIHTCYDDMKSLLPIGRIYDNHTYGMEGRQRILGLYVDIYLMYGSPTDEPSVDQHIQAILSLSRKGCWYKKWGNALYQRHLLPEGNFLLRRAQYYYGKRMDQYRKYDLDTGNYIFITSDFRRYKREYFEGRVKKTFCGEEFYVPVGWHECLTVRYKDYMQLPPVEEQVSHHYTTLYFKK